MIELGFTQEKRDGKVIKIASDLVVVGGGIAGVCAAISAARQGIRVTLVQDRPVLGGNASSEVRLWVLGATSHMGNNNRWSREGGVIEEILLENLYRNKEGNPLILDTIFLEKVKLEKNITLLLNTSVHEIIKEKPTLISQVNGFCSQNSTAYELKAPLFCDASGDGIVAFQSGASFRMGAEKKEEFDEGFAPNVNDYGELLGHSLYFYSKDLGKPVDYVAPEFAIKNVGELYRIKNFQAKEHGCKLWWVEYGGRMDTVHETEEIKWELWKVIYGIWDYVKNSGEFPEAKSLTLEWVGAIPGKRESRRFIGDYMLNQKDIVEQRQHNDAVSFGGWAMDLHPADGVYSKKSSCTQWHSKGIYQIPYRCMYSKDIENLFLAGRIISASHVAFGSSRVMATCGHGAQAVGIAAALASKSGLLPRDITKPAQLKKLQLLLDRNGQRIPNLLIPDEENLALSARIEANNQLKLTKLPFDGPWKQLDFSAAQLLPFQKDTAYSIDVQVKAQESTILKVELRSSESSTNYTPELVLEHQEFSLLAGEHSIKIYFESVLKDSQYAFICFIENKAVEVKCSESRVTGLVSVFNKHNKAVSNYGKQDPEDGLGIDTFEFWTPDRRPSGQNLAMKILPAIDCFGVNNLQNGLQRPTNKPNAFVGSLEAKNSIVELRWEKDQSIKQINLYFDGDFDHALESSQFGHPESIVPFCIRNYQILDANGDMIYSKKGNRQSLNQIEFEQPVITDYLKIILEKPTENSPCSLFEVKCYS